jgi:predicted Zn-ribbon and HTH transcriptional regulator
MQEKIMELLEKRREPMSRSEIAKVLNEKDTKVSDRLCKMVKHKELFTIEVCKEEAAAKYGSPRRLKLFYVK